MSKQSVSLSVSTDTSQAVSGIYAVTDAMDALHHAAQKTTEALREAFSSLKSVLSASRSDLSGMSADFSRVTKVSNSSSAASSTVASPSGGVSAAGLSLAAGFAALSVAAVKAAGAVKDFASDAFQAAARVQSVNARTDALLASRGQSAQAPDLYREATRFAESNGIADPAAIMQKMSDLLIAGVNDASKALQAVKASLLAGLGDESSSAAAYSALQRTAATGSLDSRTVRSLATSGIDITSALQEVLQVDAEALKALLSTGALGFDTLSAALQQFNKTNEAAAEALTGTWDSAVAQLETVWGNIKEDLFLGVVETLTPALQQLKGVLQDNRDAIVSISSVLRSGAEKVADFASGIFRITEGIGSFFAGIAAGVKRINDALPDWLGNAIADSLSQALPGSQVRGLVDLVSYVGKKSRSSNQNSGASDTVAAQRQAAEDAAAAAAAAAEEKAAAEKILADQAAAKAAEAKAKADREAAEAAARAAAAAEKLAAADRDYQYSHDIQQAQLSGDSYRARELELMRQVEQMSASMQAQGVDKATADARAAALVASGEEIARRKEAGSTGSSPYTVDPAKTQEVLRISQTSGSAQWRVLSSPIEQSNKFLSAISTTADKILSQIAARTTSNASPVLA